MILSGQYAKTLDHVTVPFIALGLRPAGNKLPVTWSNIFVYYPWNH